MIDQETAIRGGDKVSTAQHRWMPYEKYCESRNLVPSYKDDRMNTKSWNESITPALALIITKKAKGGSWYSDTWEPYCLMCSTMDRMAKKSYGFKCTCCGNEIGHNLQRLNESPLNNA